MPGFEVSVELPFRRQDVWNELYGNRPEAQGTEFSAELGVPAGVKVELSGPLQVGCTRTATIPNDDHTQGVTTSELIDYCPGFSTAWQIKSQEGMQFELRLPATTSLTLVEYPASTVVTIGYEYEGVITSNPMGYLSATAAELLRERVSSNQGQWSEEMSRRGYTALPKEGGTASSASGTRLRPSGGFAVTFQLPFRRSDVFVEASKVTSPLGAEVDEQITYTVVGEHPQPAQPERVALGITRRVDFVGPSAGQKGTVVSELVALDEGQRLVWAQLSSDCDYINFVGGPPTDPAMLSSDGPAEPRPQFALSFADAPGGTSVTLTYDFRLIALGGTTRTLACLLPCLYSSAAVRDELMQRIAQNVPMTWSRGMADRGYHPLAKPGEALGAGATTAPETPYGSAPGSGSSSSSSGGGGSGASPGASPGLGEFGLRTFTFEEESALGLHVAMRGTGLKQLYIESISPGSQAERLGVPINAQITGVHGRAMSAQEIWDALSNQGKKRPLIVSVYVSPPKPARSGSLSGRILGVLTSSRRNRP